MVSRLAVRQDGQNLRGKRSAGLNAENSSAPRPKVKCFLLTFLFIGRPISHFSFHQLKYQQVEAPLVPRLCASLASQGGNSMARKVGQIIARGDRRYLIRIYLGRDHETHKRKYHNRTISDEIFGVTRLADSSPGTRSDRASWNSRQTAPCLIPQA